MSKRKKLKNPRNWLVVAVNVLLSVFMFIALVTYYKAYQKDLYSHHVEDIKNINRSAASLFGTIYEGRRVRLGNVERYAGAFNATEEELLNYVASLNSDKNVVHELIRGDYSGLAGFRGGDSDGEFSPLNYAGAEYDSLHPIFDSASYGGEEFGITAEFLDGQSGKRSLAVYIYISLLNDEGAQDNYTLLSVSSTEYYQKSIRTSHQYTELETALVDSHGNCVIGGEKFSFDNFFDYLNANESVPASEEEKLSAFFTALGEEATLELNNPMGERCVYVCEPVDGTDWYAVSCVPINSFPSETADMSFAILIGAFFVVLMCFNICYLSSLNKKLRKSVESETVANRAKTDFLSRMSHDMRTPMNGIIGMAGFIDEATTLSEAKGYNKSVLESCKYLLMLINDTLDLNRIESGKLKPLLEVTRKKDLKNSISEEILPTLNARKLNFTLDDRAVAWEAVVVDRLRLKQILMNLLSNASKYTPEGGSVGLKVETLSDDGKRVSDRYTVWDTGAGMSKEFMRKMFEPFEQENRDPNEGGSGLGLAIAKRLVELLGGTIKCDSELGKGTEFIIELSYDKADPSKIKEAVSGRSPAADLSEKRILLVEDNQVNRAIALKLLVRTGASVEVAENGLEALDMFRDSVAGYFDVILMDLRMPIMGGIEATREIRALSRPDAKAVPIVAMTADAFSEDVERTSKAGMNAHISKPIDPKVLYQTLADSVTT